MHGHESACVGVQVPVGTPYDDFLKVPFSSPDLNGRRASVIVHNIRSQSTSLKLGHHHSSMCGLLGRLTVGSVSTAAMWVMSKRKLCRCHFSGSPNHRIALGSGAGNLCCQNQKGHSYSPQPPLDLPQTCLHAHAQKHGFPHHP